MTQIHPQARTTPKVRAEIQKASGTQREIAARFNVTVATVRKWRGRDAVQDRSHRPNKLSTTLNPAQEAIVIELRRTLLLPLDDLLVVTREFIHAGASRAALDRCLRRHGLSRLRELQQQAGEAPSRASKTFKSYEPGFIHIDIKYLPQMPDETQRRYLFVAIDRATRWVFVHIYADQSQASSCDFLWRLHQAAPMQIAKVLTDNASQFTDRFTAKGKAPSGTHAFDKRCAGLGIEHRLAPPRHPQTNGMVERFNARITEVIAQTRFRSAAELQATLVQYVQTYNARIPQRALDHRSPVQALQDWRKSSPELFTKRVHDLPGLDTWDSASIHPSVQPSCSWRRGRTTKPALCRDCENG